MIETNEIDYSPEAQFKRIFSEELKCSQLLLESEIIHLKETAAAIAKSSGHKLDDWSKDSGEYYRYGFYARCIHKYCTVFAWVTDRASRYPLRGSIYGSYSCPTRKSGG